MILISHQTVVEAFGNFRKVKDHGFWKFVGIDTPAYGRYYQVNIDAWEFPNKTAIRIEALAGPHYYAYIKAIEAKGEG